MKEYTVFLLDDEPVFSEAFGKELKSYFASLKPSFAVYTFTDTAGFEAQAQKTPPDLIFADIELKGERENGIAFLRERQKRGDTAAIIFLTAHLSYATDIFDLKPLYFILKNEFRQRIPAAVELFLENAEKKQSVLTVTSGGKTEVIPTESILYIERCLRRTVIHCADRTVDTAVSVAELMARLPEKMFARPHQSFIVNLRQVNRFGGSDVVLQNGAVLPMSRLRAEEFRLSMAEFLSGGN